LFSRERKEDQVKSDAFGASAHVLATSLPAPTCERTLGKSLDPLSNTSSADALRRLPTNQIELSKFNVRIKTPGHARKLSADSRSDPLGLTLLYTPDGPPAADIIFIHGLGGTSRQTWSYNKDPELFWPQMWLPKELDICAARILTFGYNAHFLSSGPDSVAGIGDFSKSLLFSLKFGKDDSGKDLGIGEVCFVEFHLCLNADDILVAHYFRGSLNGWIGI